MSELIGAIAFILKGSVISLELFAITAVFSIPLGIIVAFGKISKNRILNMILSIYTWVFRGTPLLIQVFFAYFALPALGISLNALTAASIAFVLNYGAYFAEIFRGGIISIEPGQFEAAKALGMNYWQAMIRIIIPQAFRNTLPSVCNEAVILIKDTSLIAVIGVGDLLRNSKEIVTKHFVIYPFLMAGITYLLITTVILLVFRKIEKKYSVY